MPTLRERASLRAPLVKKIQDQVTALGGLAELILFEDDRQFTTGHKRNVLLTKAGGKFVSFVDDDDDVSDWYVRDIVDTIIQHPDLDVIGMWGIIEWLNEGGRKNTFIHSLVCGDWAFSGDIYYRPPNHLNPIRAEIVRSLAYEDKTISEDFSWSTSMQRLGLLKYEVFLGGKPLYHYRCGGKWRTL